MNDLMSQAAAAGLTPDWTDPTWISFYTNWLISIQNNGPPSGGGDSGPPVVTVFTADTPEGTGEGNQQGIPVSIGLSHPLALGQSASVHFTIAGASPNAAGPGTDFQYLAGGVLTGTIDFFTNTDGSKDYDFFYIFTVPDDVTEADKTLTVTLTTSTGCTISTTNGSATAKIIDDDNYGISAFNDGEPDPDDPYWLIDGETLAVDAAHGVLANDIDYDPNAPPNDLTAHLVTQAEHGAVTLNTNGSWTYEETDPNEDGYDEFEYCDQAPNGRQSQPAKVFIKFDRISISVFGQNISPVKEEQGEFSVLAGWVGQYVHLELVPENQAPAAFPVNTTFAWSLSGEAVANWSGDDDASHKTPVETQLGRPDPEIYWVSGGQKAVHVTITFPATVDSGITRQGVAYADGYLYMRRPVTNVTTTFSSVNAVYDATGSYIELGTADVPNPPAGAQVEGVIFTATKDDFAEDNYQWVQLVNATETVTRDGTPYIAQTGDFVLDSSYPYQNVVGRKAKDTPTTARWLDAANPTHMTRDDDYRMYLMWKLTPDGDERSIWVPLRVVSWRWYGSASATTIFGVRHWNLDSNPGDHSPNGGSSDTTTFPQWTRRIIQFDSSSFQQYD